MTKKNKGRINLQHNLPEKKPVKNKPVYKYSKWLITGILLLTTIIYFKSLDNQLTNWDDKGISTITRVSSNYMGIVLDIP